jgi:putative tricarboxylic transport membrane protein
MQDFGAGLLFVAVGIGALWIAFDYPIGNSMRPGTGVLPKTLGWLLVGTGVILAIKALAIEGPRLTGWAWRPAIMISLATVSFAILIDRLGLMITMLISMTLAACGTPETRWIEYGLFAIFMVVLGISVFIYAIGMPIAILPTALSWR